MSSQPPDLYHVGEVLSRRIIADATLRDRLRQFLGPTRVGEALREAGGGGQGRQGGPWPLGAR